ncbi:HIT family protein [Methylocapsa palsarum]|uniref:Histidine triad (HIT) family protein n=1 Tax=Methylocapsa palsarum TaxID=1612308 RepID=A0A1I3WS98_9HYPH|nr:HIT family protein [Methylocapsa palsarum]SFK09346.1 histidine triad (HIT) family protein [Methylocapsa palsarum]
MIAVYDESNIFAKILRGDLPCHKVYEDEAVLALMDIMPRADGHVLVVPKAPARNILDVEPKVLCELMTRVQKIARAVKGGLGADGVTIQQFNEQAGGQVVFHLHFHILPRWNGVPLRPQSGAAEQPDVLEGFRVRIASALAGN